MNLRLKSIILLVFFIALLYMPFWVHAGNGNLFEGLPIPTLDSAAAGGGDGSGGENASADQYADGLSAAQEQYAESLPKPAIGSASVQQSISIEDMRNHMNIIREEGRSTNQCLACHNRTEFCDQCHSYVGISPRFD